MILETYKKDFQAVLVDKNSQNYICLKATPCFFFSNGGYNIVHFFTFFPDNLVRFLHTKCPNSPMFPQIATIQGTFFTFLPHNLVCC